MSRHTGASLSRLIVSTVASGRVANDSLLQLLDRAKADGVVSIPEADAPPKQWKIGEHSWSHSDGESVYSHTLELTEAEVLRPTSISIEDLSIQPYGYEERFDDDRLVIEAKIAVSEQQHLQLKELLLRPDTFSVTRHGVSEKPVEMRFGLCYWSQSGTVYKHSLVLVDMTLPDKRRGLANAFQWTVTLRGRSVHSAAVLESLLDSLVRKGILTNDEVQLHVLQILFEDKLNCFYGVRFPFPFVFCIGKGKRRIVFDCQPDHLFPMVKRCDLAIDFMRRSGSGDKNDPV